MQPVVSMIMMKLNMKSNLLIMMKILEIDCTGITTVWEPWSSFSEIGISPPDISWYNLNAMPTLWYIPCRQNAQPMTCYSWKAWWAWAHAPYTAHYWPILHAWIRLSTLSWYLAKRRAAEASVQCRYCYLVKPVVDYLLFSRNWPATPSKPPVIF